MTRPLIIRYGDKSNLRDVVRLVGVQGIRKSKLVKEKPMKNVVKRLVAPLFVLAIMVGSAHAEATAYFSLPADFADSVKLTIVGIAGGILVILGLMFAWRKTVKSVNRS